MNRSRHLTEWEFEEAFGSVRVIFPKSSLLVDLRQKRLGRIPMHHQTRLRASASREADGEQSRQSSALIWRVATQMASPRALAGLVGRDYDNLEDISKP